MDVSGIVRAAGWTTPMKTRFLAGWTHTVGQQVLRVDYEPKTALDDSVRKKLRQLLLAKITKVDALAISDYGFGVVSPKTLAAPTVAAKRIFQ